MDERYRFEAEIAVGEPPKTIMQGADGEVKPDPPIEIYRSELHGHWIVRWGLHEYATKFPNNTAADVVVAYMELASGEKVKVAE